MIRHMSRKTWFFILRLAAFVGGAELAGLVFRIVHTALRHQGKLP